MGPKHFWSALQAEVRAEKNQRLFVDAQRSHAVLQRYIAPGEVLDVLLENPGDLQEKDALTWALIAEQRVRPAPFWAALLLLAYGPMIRRLRRRVGGGSWIRADVDQLVITSFLEVVVAFPPTRTASSSLSSILMQATTRHLFLQVRDKAREDFLVQVVAPEDLDETVVVTQPAFESDEPSLAPKTVRDAKVLVKRLVEAVDQGVRAADLGLMTSTLVRGEKLQAYIARVHPDVGPGDYRNLYERLKRRRTRAMARLRDSLEGLRPS